MKVVRQLTIIKLFKIIPFIFCQITFFVFGYLPLFQDNFNESYHTPYVHPGLKYIADEKYYACQFDLYESMHCRMLMPGFIPSKSVYNEEDKVLESLGPHMEYWDMNPEDYKGKLLEIRGDIQKRYYKI